VHVERMHLPDPTPENHVETRFDRDGSGTRMTMRMTLPDSKTRAAVLAYGRWHGRQLRAIGSHDLARSAPRFVAKLGYPKRRPRLGA